jgi:hypothetical protein
MVSGGRKTRGRARSALERLQTWWTAVGAVLLCLLAFAVFGTAQAMWRHDGWGSVGEWFAGIGTVAAVGVALGIAVHESRVSERRRAADATDSERRWELDLTMKLAVLVEEDRVRSAGQVNWHRWPESSSWRSAEAIAIVAILTGRGHHGWMGCVWEIYGSEPLDQFSAHLSELARNNHLWPSVRSELSERVATLANPNKPYY